MWLPLPQHTFTQYLVFPTQKEEEAMDGPRQSIPRLGPSLTLWQREWLYRNKGPPGPVLLKWLPLGLPVSRASCVTMDAGREETARFPHPRVPLPLM